MAAHCVLAYTVYLTFPYENGVEYRVTNNLSHIGVLAPDGHAIVDYWVPLECDASVVQAFKRRPTSWSSPVLGRPRLLHKLDRRVSYVYIF